LVGWHGNREPHVIFQADGHQIAGAAGCNLLLGSYELGGDNLRIVVGGSTRMPCPEPLMRQERDFVDMLRATSGYRIDGNALELRDGPRLLARLTAHNTR
jgi:heat shock protein HslJ